MWLLKDSLIVNCPKCGKKALTMPKWIITYYDPSFSHKPCGYSGKLFWVNEEVAKKEEELIAKVEEKLKKAKANKVKKFKVKPRKKKKLIKKTKSK